MATVPQDAEQYEYPETLILKAGDTIAGRFQRLEVGHTRDGDERAIAVLDVDGAERSLWLHEIALRNKLRKLAPEPGELVSIAKGAEKKKAASGRFYWPFKVTAPERPTELLTWDNPLLADDDEDEVTSEPDVPIGPVADLELSAGADGDDSDIPF